VNVLPGFLGHGGLASAIANSNLLDVIDQLVVEVTERGLTEKTEPDRLHTKGNGRARVALDDSALSESSFVVLSRARVDIVKIDKPFVDRLPANDCAPGALPELARLLRAANHVVIAEGVETAAQADCLRRLGVHLAQGWHFSRALPVSEFLRYFAAHR
jgi:sensor c-di-GMP phosphodiesterase-like protein